MTTKKRNKPEYNGAGFLEKCIVDGKPLSKWSERTDVSFNSSVAACNDCGSNYMRNSESGKTYIYKRNSDGWNCVDCKSEISAVERIHSIHEFPEMPLAGFGKTVRVQVPYCPKCEKEPSSHGHSLREDPKDVAEIRLIREIGKRL